MLSKALVFAKPYDLQIEEVQLQPDLQDDEILIRTECSLISPGTELALYTGTHVGINDPDNTFAKFPFYPGYSVVGEVVAVGAKATRFSTGDTVYTLGKHAAYNVVSVGDPDNKPVVRIGHIPPSRAVFARLAAITLTAIVQSDIRIGDIAVIIGMGLIGNLAAQLFSVMGAEVVAVDVVPERLDMAREMGIANTILSGNSVDLGAELRKRTGADNADIVVEATGSPRLVVPALDLVKYLGQVIALGSTRGSVDLDVYKHVHSRGVRFIGAHENLQDLGGFASTRLELTRYALKLIRENMLKIDPLITHRLHYTDAGYGYDRLLNKKSHSLGILLNWE